MKADKGQFDEVLRRMLKKAPQKTEQIKNPRPRKNPETDPAYLPVFDFSQKLTPEQLADVEQQRKLLKEYERAKKKR